MVNLIKTENSRLAHNVYKSVDILFFFFSCSQCLQTNNACGWCVYNKVCSATADSCLDGTDGFLKV